MFVAGKTTGFADFSIWPFLERFPAITLDPKTGVKEFPGTKYPKLTAYIERMKQQPEVQAVMKPLEIHAQFLKSAWVDEKPDYNLGI